MTDGDCGVITVIEDMVGNWGVLVDGSPAFVLRRSDIRRCETKAQFLEMFDARLDEWRASRLPTEPEPLYPRHANATTCLCVCKTTRTDGKI